MGTIKKVAFTGHRPKSLPWGFDEETESCVEFKKRLQEEIEIAIGNGYTYFLSGVGMGVDIIAARSVLDLKAKYPEIMLECVIPYEEQATRWSVAQREIYFNILAECDKTHMVSMRYSDDVYSRRNLYLVEHADLIIAVYNKQKSGTGQTVRYAQKANKEVIIIDPASF